MHDLIKDIRFGVRMLARHPIVTVICLLTLGLGIGASTAVFSVVDATLLSPLPFPEPDRLVSVSASKPAAGWPFMTISYPNFTDWSEQSSCFEATGIFGFGAVNVRGEEHPDRFAAVQASAGVLEVLQVQPILGRVHDASNDRADADSVVLLSETVWRERFAAAPDVVGETLAINEVAHEIIGVLPAETRKAVGRFDVWLPFTYGDVKENRGNRHYGGIARLKPGFAIEDANIELAAIADRLAEIYPDSNRGYSANTRSLTEVRLGNRTHSVVFVLCAAVGFVLLIACVNIANLLLSTAGNREREFAVRAALGAGPRRLLRQLMTESMLLALGGGLLGIAIATWSVDILTASLQTTVRFIGDTGVDDRALSFTFLVLLATTVGFGLPVALKVSGSGFSRIVQSNSRSGFGTRRDRIRRESLVVIQVALALALMISSALMIRSLINLKTVDPGFNSDNLLTLRVLLPQQSYPTDTEVSSFFERSIREIATVPGVQSVSAASTIPLVGSTANTGVTIEDQPISDPSETVFVGAEAVAPGYLETMGIALLEGREFTTFDRTGDETTVIVSRSTARHFWPDESALGKRMKYGGSESSNPWMTVVGVMEDYRFTSLESEPRLETLYPMMSFSARAMTFVVRTVGDPAAATEDVRKAIWRVGPELAIFQVATMDEVVERNTTSIDNLTTLLIGFGLVALVLALGGLYGVMSFTVGRRTKEIGLRMALGAQARSILRTILQRSTLLVVVGLAVGGVIALMLSRTLSEVLFEIGSFDPVAYAAVAAVMLAVGILAGLVPALKAARVDPVIALRHE
ncbi:MAG: ABC transporter permease [Thermoanaerobaculales bacterium]|jgi:putative ABC transport system permease protein|nr:ABC transporter permease [Thermoanaerobaculales bacterium]